MVSRLTGIAPVHLLVIPRHLRRFQHKIHMHRVKGEDYPAFFCFLQYTGFEKRLNIAMYRLHIPFHSTSFIFNRTFSSPAACQKSTINATPPPITARLPVAEMACSFLNRMRRGWSAGVASKDPIAFLSSTARGSMTKA